MGVSTYGILCYGFRLKDEEGNEEGISIPWLRRGRQETDEDEDNMLDFEEFVIQLSGLHPPDIEFSQSRYETDPAYQQSWASYWDEKRKLLAEIGVTLVSHCSSEEQMYILAATASVKKASRGNPIELGQTLTALPEWRETIRIFCERAGIHFEEPKFILCSYVI